MCSEDALPHAWSLRTEALGSLCTAACPLLAKVLLNRKTRVVRDSVLRGLQPLRLTERRPVIRLEGEGLGEGSIRKNSLMTAQVERRARAVEEVTDVLLEIDRRPSTLATWSCHRGRTSIHRLGIDVIDMEALEVR